LTPLETGIGAEPERAREPEPENKLGEVNDGETRRLGWKLESYLNQGQLNSCITGDRRDY